MADTPKFTDAVEMALKLGFPPTTLTLRPGQAAGHRLARPVNMRGAAPDRSFACVQGLAVNSADVIARSGSSREHNSDNSTEPVSLTGTNLTLHIPANGNDTATGDLASSGETATLTLRPMPSGKRREDSLRQGEAVAVSVGETLPRGTDMVYPFALIPGAMPERTGNEPLPPEPEPEEENNEDLTGLPVATPPADWQLTERHREGAVDVPMLSHKLEGTSVTYGAWARNRDPVIAERTVLRAGELAMLEAMGVEEVSVYRRPVVGVACLQERFAESGESGDNGGPELPPLLVLATQLVRSSRVAALPLSTPPLKFRPLARMVKRWLDQVDILLLVGGSGVGHRCLGHDIVSAMGEVAFEGVDLQPGGNTTLGTVNGKPVVAIPGSLADIVASYVLLVRPLAHRYLSPNLFCGSMELELEHGSRLSVDHDTVVPVRFGPAPGGRGFSTRFSGRVRDPWLDYVRGQALLVLEGGRKYHDGEIVEAFTY